MYVHVQCMHELLPWDLGGWEGKSCWKKSYKKKIASYNRNTKRIRLSKLWVELFIISDSIIETCTICAQPDDVTLYYTHVHNILIFFEWDTHTYTDTNIHIHTPQPNTQTHTQTHTRRHTHKQTHTYTDTHRHRHKVDTNIHRHTQTQTHTHIKTNKLFLKNYCNVICVIIVMKQSIQWCPPLCIYCTRSKYISVTIITWSMLRRIGNMDILTYASRLWEENDCSSVCSGWTNSNFTENYLKKIIQYNNTIIQSMILN